MFEEINNLRILNRKLTEEDDYLSQEEYDTIIENLKPDESIDLFLDILRKYNVAGKCDFKYEGDENTFYFPSEIKVNKEDGYYSSSKRDIVFVNDIFDINKRNGKPEFRERNSHTEGKFKSEYLTYVNKLLSGLASEYEFIRRETYHSSYYNAYEIYPVRFLSEHEEMKRKAELANRISAYYKCRIVNVKIDEEFNKELQELEDFINSI